MSKSQYRRVSASQNLSISESQNVSISVSQNLSISESQNLRISVSQYLRISESQFLRVSVLQSKRNSVSQYFLTKSSALASCVVLQRFFFCIRVFLAFLLGCWTPNAFSTSEPEQGHSNHGHKPNQDSHYSLQWAHSEKGQSFLFKLKPYPNWIFISGVRHNSVQTQ